MIKTVKNIQIHKTLPYFKENINVTGHQPPKNWERNRLLSQIKVGKKNDATNSRNKCAWEKEDKNQ